MKQLGNILNKADDASVESVEHSLEKTKFNESNHCMIDIETIATGTNAVIASISAVQFNPLTGDTFSEFEVFIDIQSQLEKGFEIEADTMFWWMEQDENVRKELIRKCKNGLSISSSLEAFTVWIRQNKIKYSWGKGPSFDQAKIANAFRRCKLRQPLQYWNEFCVRTLIAFDDSVKKFEFDGDAHRGIDDSKHQIKQVSTNLQRMSISIINNDVDNK